MGTIRVVPINRCVMDGHTVLRVCDGLVENQILAAPKVLFYLCLTGIA